MFLDTDLSAYNQFLAEVHSLPEYTREDELHLIALARQGESLARQRLVELLLPAVVSCAKVFASGPKSPSFLDAVQMGAELLLENMDRALQSESPCAYLLVVVSRRLPRICGRYDLLIKKPVDCEYTFQSLDAPLTDESTSSLLDILPAPSEAASDRDFASLYQALSQLSLDRQELLVHRYGLFDCAPTSRADLAREMFPDAPVQRSENALRSREHGALLALQELMTSSYLEVEQDVPQEYYVAGEIKRRYGVAKNQLRLCVTKGQLTRYPAPPDARDSMGRPVTTYVYAKSEVDTLFADRLQSCASALAFEYYTFGEIKRRYGVTRAQIDWAISKGQLTRYPAPPDARASRGVPAYVYRRSEVDTLWACRLASPAVEEVA